MCILLSGAYVFVRFTLNTSDRAPAPLEPMGEPLVNICAFMGLLFLAINWVSEHAQSFRAH